MTYTPPSDPGQPIQNPGAPQYSTYGTPGGYAAPGSTYGTAAYAPKPKSDKSTFGLWALIAGIVGVVIPFVLPGMAAVALGIVGLVKEQKKGMAITGIVLGGLGIFVMPWVAAFVWALIFSAVGYSTYY